MIDNFRSFSNALGRGTVRATANIVFLAATLAACRAETVAVVRDAEIRPAIAGSTTAGYFLVDNGTRDTVVVDSVTTTVTSMVELHETTIDSAGVARMRPVEALVVPPDSVVILRPGGLHLMLMNVAEPLEAGQRIPLTLWLRGGSTLVTSAVVKARGSQ